MGQNKSRVSRSKRIIQAKKRYGKDSFPKYLYKYQRVDLNNVNDGNLDKDSTIKRLFDCEAILSSRLNFNDLFDSKVKIIPPTPKQIIATPGMLKLISDGQFTIEGKNFIDSAIVSINDLIDSYLFYCLSKNNKSNLMWSHYADSHRGFCIEFNTEFLKADKVNYKNKIPEIELIEFLNPKTQESFSKKIWDSLRTKLIEWKYEDEYRFQPGHNMPVNKLPKGVKTATVKYESTWIESIIFGCRTDERVKKYITNNIPYGVKFKQATQLDSSIDIVDYEVNS